MNSALLSIIIPIYNTKLYIEDCIQSILSQEYHNIEILLVDDGSTDGSTEICQHYAKEYSCIKYFYQCNKGVSSARNTGIENSKGDYIGFMDSDDKISPYIYKELIKCIEKDNSDLCVCAYRYWFPIENRIKDIKQSINGIYARNEAVYHMMTPHGYRAYVFTKIFRGSLLRKSNIRFDENIKMMEDLDFVVRYTSLIERISFVKEPYYYYRMRSDSAIHTMQTKEKLLAFERIIPFVSSKYSIQNESVIRWNYYATLLEYAKEIKTKDIFLFENTIEKIIKERSFFLRHKPYSFLGFIRKIIKEFFIRFC